MPESSAVQNTGKISVSAWSIAQSFSCLSKNERWKKLVKKEELLFYQQCLKYCSKHSSFCSLMGKIPEALLYSVFNRIIAFGAPVHFVLRKRAIADEVQLSIQNGVQQIVVLGGGFDLLAFNTASANQGIDCFEIDTPDMHAHKMSILRTTYNSIPANFYGEGIDLSCTPLQAALSSIASYSPEKKTLFVAEGLTMYLSEPQVRMLFASIKQVCSAGVSLYFTAVPVHPGSSGFWNKFRKVVLGVGEENPSWCILESRVGDFLKENAYTLQYTKSYAGLQLPYRNEQEMAVLKRQNGEYLVYSVAR